MAAFRMDGIVAARDKQPYLQLSSKDRIVCRFSMAQARKIAHDMLVMASRTEADAMILKFFDKATFPPEAGPAPMTDFRDYRAELDQEKFESAQEEPGT